MVEFPTILTNPAIPNVETQQYQKNPANPVIQKFDNSRTPAIPALQQFQISEIQQFQKIEVLSVPHRFLPDSGDSGGILCIPEEWKLAEGSAKSAIPVISRSGGILAFRN
jgi:hypothetical protein